MFSFRREGQRYFVLVQGDYPDLAAARGAVAELPPEVRADKPWARPLVEIQGLIRADQ